MMFVCFSGPPDKTFKYKITPWPVLTPGKSVNVTVTFTPSKSVLLFQTLRDLCDDSKSPRGKNITDNLRLAN